VGVRVDATFFGQSIGIDDTNTFQLKYLSSMKIVGATGLGGLWACIFAKQTCAAYKATESKSKVPILYL